ncbi:MAG TPA: SDR family oxidoreductase [Chloroflexota bacterium]|nr:SDR family oxidoreductase [Chloroflexota bacterium]
MVGVTNKVVIVTGAASGQGAGEALALARAGARVIATDLREQAPAWIADADHLAYRRLDVARPADWQALSAWIGERHGRVDGLVNNAGTPNRERLLDVTLAEWERVLAVNVTGALLGIQTIVPWMTNGGAIVNVGSVAGLTGHYAAAYTASKWALRGLSRVASLELGPRGIRVNAIHPGYIETPMTAAAPDAFRTTNAAQTPLGRTGQVEDVVPLVVFLLSDEAAFISGADIPVDGGMSGHGGMKPLSDAAATGRLPTDPGPGASPQIARG